MYYECNLTVKCFYRLIDNVLHLLYVASIFVTTQSHNIITSTGLNLINCNHIHYSPSSTLLALCTSRVQLFAHSLALHTLSHCTSYPLFYFIICFLFHSHHICIYIYSLVFCFIVFIALCYFILLLCFIYFFLHFPLSGSVLTNISLPIIPCIDCVCDK